jgi:hypothetical protein
MENTPRPPAGAIPLNALVLGVGTHTRCGSLFIRIVPKSAKFPSNSVFFRRCGGWKEMRANDRKHINYSN